MSFSMPWRRTPAPSEAAPAYIDFVSDPMVCDQLKDAMAANQDAEERLRSSLQRLLDRKRALSATLPPECQ